MKRSAFFALLLLLVFASSAAAKHGRILTPVLGGSQSIQSQGDAEPGGQAEAFPFRAGLSGTAQSITVYVGQSTSLHAALYAGSGANPGRLLVQGTIAAKRGWTTATIPNTALTAGVTYWIALLGNSNLTYQDGNSQRTSCYSVNTPTSQNITSFPASFPRGAVYYSCPLSAYVSGTTGTAPTAPANTTLERITGNAAQGQTLSSGTGTWTGTAPIGYTYAWSNGATGTTDLMGASDVGDSVTVTVTATNSAGSATAKSIAVGPVTGTPPPPTPPVDQTVPTISGTPAQGQTLTASTGTWTGTAPIGYTYAWSDGATGATDLLDASDVGQRVTVTVTATNSAGSATAKSTAVGPVTGTPPPPTPPVDQSVPTITGTPHQGDTLSASPGSWTGTAPIGFSYLWSDGTAGATDLLTAADVGHTVSVVVTASNGAGSAQAASTAVGPVTASGGGGSCTTTVSGVTAAQNAVATAGSGDVVCVTAGAYGGASFSHGSVLAENVTVEPDPALDPNGAGKVTFAGIVVGGNNVTVHNVYSTGGIDVEAATNAIIDHNDVSSGGYGITVGGVPSSAYVTLSGNRIHNTSFTSEGDSLRIGGVNHLTITGNDIYNIRECPADNCHTDTAQFYTGGLTIGNITLTRNYIHDTVNAQGFPFMKDSDFNNVTLSDNLSVRMASAGETTGPGFYTNIPGLLITHNTYLGAGGYVQAGGSQPGPSVNLNHNVFDTLNNIPVNGAQYAWTESYDYFPGNNQWTEPLGSHSAMNTALYTNPAANFLCGSICGNGSAAGDDYRLNGWNDPISPDYGIGIDWSPAAQTYGPA